MIWGARRDRYSAERSSSRSGSSTPRETPVEQPLKVEMSYIGW
jgi:hypothetical protein